jgi:hypothetical protein
MNTPLLKSGSFNPGKILFRNTGQQIESLDHALGLT